MKFQAKTIQNHAILITTDEINDSIPASVVKNITVPVGRDIHVLSDKLCPDNKTKCKDNDTCCSVLGGSDMFCCPFPDAVCCEKSKRCCPKGFVCEPGAGEELLLYWE